MLTYALGRGLEYYDRCAVDEILEALDKDDYRFSTLIVGVVKSEPFQMRTATRGQAMSDGGRISRRTVLRGVGTVVALPFLEAMLPQALAAAAGASRAAAADGLPLRAQRRHHGRLDARGRGGRLRTARRSSSRWPRSRRTCWCSAA